MTIETDEDYRQAVERLAGLSDRLDEELDNDEYLDITAAMLDYETRHHPVLNHNKP